MSHWYTHYKLTILPLFFKNLRLKLERQLILDALTELCEEQDGPTLLVSKGVFPSIHPTDTLSTHCILGGAAEHSENTGSDSEKRNHYRYLKQRELNTYISDGIRELEEMRVRQSRDSQQQESQFRLCRRAGQSSGSCSH